MERMMKVQDVLLKAMAKKITWWAAAEIIGVTDRTMRRWRERLEKDGYAGLADRRKGKPSAQRACAAWPPGPLPATLSAPRCSSTQCHVRPAAFHESAECSGHSTSLCTGPAPPPR